MNLFEARVFRDADHLAIRVEGESGEKAFEVPLPPPSVAPVVHARLADGQALHLGVRPHRVQLGDGEGAIRGVVSSNHWLGDQSHVGIALPGGAMLIAVEGGVVEAPIGGEIAARIPPDGLHLFDATTGEAIVHGMEPA